MDPIETILELYHLLSRHETQLLQILAMLMMICGFIVFVILLFQPATYGRYSSTGRFYSIAIPAKLAWFLQEVPAFLVSSYCVVVAQLYPKTTLSIVQAFVVGCFIFHYFYRSLIYPFLIKGGKPTPIYAFTLAFIFCTVNGYMQAKGVLLLTVFPKDNLLTSLRLVIGFSLFCFGLFVNVHSDHVLRNLRKPGEKGYKIPQGGLFSKVSCANFFGEILEWIGFAIMAWSSVSLAFAYFTISNLVPRALTHHRFYREKFDDYPDNRKAVIPYLL